MAVLGVFVLPPSAAAQETETPAALYARAQAKEEAARAAEPPAAQALRGAATAYEILFRDYPASGYADNAVWQAARLLSLAWQRSGDAGDLKHAEKWFRWLQQEYPYSPFVGKVESEMDALHRAAAPPPASTPSAGPATVKGITTTPLPQGQRIAIEFSQEVQFTRERVDGPDRVYFDFANTTISAAVVERTQAISGTFLKSVRVGHPSPGVTRLVFDLTGQPRYSAFPFYDPFRICVDVVDAQKPAPTPAPAPPPIAARPAASIVSPAPPPASSTTAINTHAGNDAKKPSASGPSVSPAAASTTSHGDYSLGRQLGLGVSRIVIDAGHGGHDPGAMANGVTEAELVLDVALRLEKLLGDLGGFQVVLTRHVDDFIPLEERTAVANRAGADLFLSIHANASRDASARGVETYFLNLSATNQLAEAVAARENALSAQNMGELPGLVKAITLNNKMKESRELATIVQSSLMRRMSLQNKALKDLGVKQAPFMVLIGATMPSVLAEISFLTNSNEALLLKQGGFRQKIAQALCDAIVKYQGSLKKTTSIAAKDGGR
jgi:N-acetylmuramoyl-L-alanine amidase